MAETMIKAGFLDGFFERLNMPDHIVSAQIVGIVHQLVAIPLLIFELWRRIPLILRLGIDTAKQILLSP